MNPARWALTADSARQIREIVAANIRRERELKSMSHRALAARSAVDIGTVAHIEASRREPKISTLVAFSFGLYVPLPSLLAGVPSPAACESVWMRGAKSAADWTLTPENARVVREVIGKNLRLQRERTSTPQRVLARESGVGEDTIVRTEAARQEAKLFTLVALSFGLDVPLMSLFAGVPSP